MKTYLYVAIILDIIWTVIGGVTIWWGIKYSSLFWLIIGIVCILGSVISVGYAVIKYKNSGDY
ncbi:MAG: hypothetical protein ACR2NC_04295 [Thermodesulfobacteriota bacterium]